MLYFGASDGADFILWASDGTAAGTRPVTDASGNTVRPDGRLMAPLNGTLYFYATGSSGNYRLWKTTNDSTAVELPTFRLGGAPRPESYNSLAWAGAFYFWSEDVLWKYDGSSEHGRSLP